MTPTEDRVNSKTDILTDRFVTDSEQLLILRFSVHSTTMGKGCLPFPRRHLPIIKGDRITSEGL